MGRRLHRFGELLKSDRIGRIWGMKVLLRALVVFCFGILCAGAAEKQVGIGPSFKGPLGLQMYSLRFHTQSNAMSRIDKARELGFRAIEGGAPMRMPPGEFLKMLEERGMKLISTGADYQRLKNDPDGLVAQAKGLGAK